MTASRSSATLQNLQHTTSSALICVPSFVTADEALKSSAAWPAIEKARNCDDGTSIAFSQLKYESAEQVAKAAFDKCHALWDSAHEVYYQTSPKPPSPSEIPKNPWAYKVQLDLINADAERNTVEAWKATEIDRLRVLVMETRLKNAPSP
jgi:hypothetical protein